MLRCDASWLTLRTALLLLILEALAISMGAYSWSFLHHHERGHVALATIMLCFGGLLSGLLVTHPTWWKRTSAWTLIGAGVLLAVGLCCRLVLHYHERAALPFGLGLLALGAGLGGLLVARSWRATFGGITILGGGLLGMGILFLLGLSMNGRAFVAFGLGGILLVSGLLGLLCGHRSPVRQNSASS